MVVVPTWKEAAQKKRPHQQARLLLVHVDLKRRAMGVAGQMEPPRLVVRALCYPRKQQVIILLLFLTRQQSIQLRRRRRRRATRSKSKYPGRIVGKEDVARFAPCQHGLRAGNVKIRMQCLRLLVLLPQLQLPTAATSS